MVIEYDGSRYYGWEHQPGIKNTIQGKLESVLSQMAGKPVEVIGAGRTDAGVHALGMTANTHIETDMTASEVQEYMNHYLPEDICVRELQDAPDRFHARYNAKGKIYRYTIWTGKLKPVFERKYVYVPEKIPDIGRMKKAAAFLVGTHDFRSFCGNPHMKKSTVREIYSISIVQNSDKMEFTYHGRGFLQYMIRIMTGTLLEVGIGKREPESMPELIEMKDRSKAGYTVPAKGLCLMQVDYDETPARKKR